mmetsp:Transcript_19430/g.29201  ORF Transcript_19430/g.29201 Transcript_19430/m.29201 type:complete len:428 (+) Transcript_19430:39-1322(+)
MTAIRRSKSSRTSYYSVILLLLRIGFFGLVAFLVWEGFHYKDWIREYQSIQIIATQQQQTPATISNSPISSPAVTPSPQRQKLVREMKAEVKKKNDEEKLAIVLFTHLSSTSTMERFIFPALETYYQNESEPLFLVMVNKWKNAYADLCHSSSKYCDRLHILWVDCPEGYFGESPCCKQEKGLLELLKYERAYDWILFADDDTYFRMDYLKSLLSKRIRPRLNSTSNVLFTGNGLGAKGLGQYGYKSKIQSQYLCAKDYRYPWGQPVIYSSASLNLIKRGLELGGLVKQCLEYNVTHDAGNAIFHWMYGIPDMAFRVQTFAEPEDNTTKRASDVLAVHGIDRMFKEKPTLTMHQVHDSIATSSFGWKRYHRQVRERLGYNQTSTYVKYGHPWTWTDEWHTMPRKDCMDEETRMEAMQRYNGLLEKKW